MECSSPLKGWFTEKVNDSGKRGVVFSAGKAAGADEDFKIDIPCGRCMGCRLTYAQSWAIRCMAERQLHDAASFITLTFDNDHLPVNHSLDRRHLQLFFKRVRKATATPIRYFASGEYGQRIDVPGHRYCGRPHYHAIIFGREWYDRVPISKGKSGHVHYKSAELERLWGQGMCNVGDVSIDSCGYVARYCTKKISGDMADEHYTNIDPITGEYTTVEPEFALMSRGRQSGGGIGGPWAQKYWRDLQKGYVTFEGTRYPVPDYFKSIVEQQGGTVKDFYRKDAWRDPENSESRKGVKDKCLKLKTKNLNRKL